jgi:hypothetical protein
MKKKKGKKKRRKTPTRYMKKPAVQRQGFFPSQYNLLRVAVRPVGMVGLCYGGDDIAQQHQLKKPSPANSVWPWTSHG